MDYMFHFSTVDAAALLPQVRRALKKRAELFPDPQRPARRKPVLPLVLSAIPTAAGAALLATGAKDSRKRSASLTVGAAGIAAGAATLLLGLCFRRDPIEAEARLLLEKQMDLPQDQTLQAIFSPAAMILMDKNGARTVLYHDIGHVIEEEDLFLLTHGDETTILLKKDLAGDLDGFCDFIGDKTFLV